MCYPPCYPPYQCSPSSSPAPPPPAHARARPLGLPLPHPLRQQPLPLRRPRARGHPRGHRRRRPSLPPGGSPRPRHPLGLPGRRRRCPPRAGPGGERPPRASAPCSPGRASARTPRFAEAPSVFEEVGFRVEAAHVVLEVGLVVWPKKHEPLPLQRVILVLREGFPQVGDGQPVRRVRLG